MRHGAGMALARDRKSLAALAAGEICIYTNRNHTIEVLE
jgi:hypothetical protein